MKRSIIILTILFFGCQTTGTAPVSMTQEQISSDQEAIKAVIDWLATTWNENDFKSYCSVWAEGSKVITRDGETYIVKKENEGQRIKDLQKRRNSVGKVKYGSKWIKLASLTEASGSSEFICFTCKDGGIAKASVRFKFVKQDGKWLVMLKDSSH